MTVDGLSILVMLAFGIAAFLLAAFLAPYFAAAFPINRYWPRFCQLLCDLRALLGFIFGIAVGLFFCLCWRLILEMLGSEIWCIRILCLLLLIAFLLAFIYAWAAACCPGQGRWTPAAGNWLALILLLLALLVLALLLYVGGQTLETLRSTHCARILFVVILIGVLVILLRALGCRYCIDPAVDVVRVAVSVDRGWCSVWTTILGYLLALLLLLILWLIWYCRHDLEARFELAMVGIWWEGKYEGDTGAHLRWAFDEPLPFPQNGFDLYRRESSGGAWTQLNAPGAIFPSTTWSGPGDPTRWIDRGVDRLPTVVHPRYEGANSENFDHLQEMLAYPNLYASLFYVEGIDAPFTNQTLADQAADAAAEPVARWDISPMALLQTIALHPEVARLLGLYYIDATADPNVEYDYRIVGHWLDRDRFYEVKKLSGPNTQALPPPVLQKADALPDSTKPIPGGGWWPTEARVALRWDPPTADPNDSFGPADGIQAVFHNLQRRDVGPALGPLTTPGPYEVVTVPDDAGQFVPMDPVVAQPEELPPTNTLSWPDYFAYDAWVDYRTYDYLAVGIDVFGRESQPSLEKRVSVLDTVAPPPPLNVEATIYQRADPEVGRLRQAEREKLFPTGSNNEFAIRVGWIWTDALKQRYPDLKVFRIFYRFTDFDSFSLPANRTNWPDTTQYEAQLGADKAVADAEPAIPARYSDPSSPTGFVFPAAENPADPPASYYEEVFTNLDPAFIALITADDNPTVKYGFTTVASVDHDPFNNVGQGATPVTVFSRDFIPPPRPSAPVLHAAPGEADRAGNVHLTMRVAPATEIYRYAFSRVARSQLISIADPGALPAGCVEVSDPDQAEQQRKATAAGAPLRQVNAISIVPATPPSGPPNADLVDGLDATVGTTQIYVSYAIDPAGNKSEPSCPAIPVQIIDRVAPRQPVVTKAVGADGAISLTWSGNREADLSRYLVYRTAEEERLTSKRRMQIVLDANPTGVSQDPSLEAEDAIPEAVEGEMRFTWNDRGPRAGTTYYYRIVAEDESDNASEPSTPVSARALDLTPPVAPTWPASGAISVQADAEGTERFSLAWEEAADDPSLSYLVRRRAVGAVPWVVVSTWAEGSSFMDLRSNTGTSYEYQVRAMDNSGNRSDWSDSQTSP